MFLPTTQPPTRPLRPTNFWTRGEPFVWATAAALAFTLALTLLLLAVVLANGLGVFWPHPLFQIQLAGGQTLLGEIVDRETDPHTKTERLKIKTGNREDGPAFRWIDRNQIRSTSRPPAAFKLDRATNLNYYGFLQQIRAPQLDLSLQGDLPHQLAAALAAARDVHTRQIKPIEKQEALLARQINDHVKYALIDAQYRKKQLLHQGGSPQSPQLARLDAQIQQLHVRQDRLEEQSRRLSQRRLKAERALDENVAVFADAGGRRKQIPLPAIVRFSCPNRMSLPAKARFYLAKVWELLSANPREANQDGGLFPAIFGTVLLVFLMAVTCFPLGVLAGVYLGEYAGHGPLVRLVRVAVNNLAGVPSIVYGIFGLGFFIYICGGYLDQAFFPARVDAGEPVFGQGCILWASLTLGLLTIPVVIVATEEALRAIPREVHHASHALGATRLQTLLRVLLPMASPGIITGFILAMARAAGEVAPLMITGAVKSAPVPLQSGFPFLRLDRQFMHLGFHVFDISCKSPNVEATKPMVYVTTLLLMLIVLGMTGTAIWLRARMRKQYQLPAI